ncbi:MAG: RNA-binding protein, partial [Myxococcales bacterium]|nr:RNA-binding protein [Myxococcales bacterium]
MSRKIFVGNLNFATEGDSLRDFCASAGTVVDVHIPLDRESGRPRGFAFVTFSSEEEAAAAVERLDGQALDGRPLRINTAEERRPRGGGGGGGPRPGGGGG